MGAGEAASAQPAHLQPGVTGRAHCTCGGAGTAAGVGWNCPRGSAGCPPATGSGVLAGPCQLHSGFLQTKALIDKLQKLVSSEGRFKNLREALKK